MSEYSTELLRIITNLEWCLKQAQTNTHVQQTEVHMDYNVYNRLWHGAREAKNFLLEQHENLRKLEE